MFSASEQVLSPSTLWRRSALPALMPWLLTSFVGLLLLAVAYFWRIWTTDPLRSIGMCFPIVSIVLIVRAWRQLCWESRGTWWGVLPLLYAVIMSFLGGEALEVIVPALRVPTFHLLPLSLTLFAYGTGVVLLLGGQRVWRKTLFPLSLLLFANPVPGPFLKMDLTLQYFCARTARAFASAMGVHPDGNQLRLMFTPDFGMFIAPACNGMRGAVTMGYLALVLGYVQRLSLRMRTLLVIGAVFLAYAFNLLRLCTLVLFYRVALRFPFLQPHAEGADYLLGGCLFLCAAVLFALVVQRAKERADKQEMTLTRTPDCVPGANPNQSAPFYKGVAVSLLAMLSVFPYLGSLLDIARSKPDSGESVALVSNITAEHIGKYRLLRTWMEGDSETRPLYRWETYTAGNTTDEIEVGFYLGPQPHFPIACHISRGDKPLWQRTQKLSTANGGSATFDLSLYEDGEGQTLEATTVCDDRGCNEYALLRSGVGVVFADLALKDFRLRSKSGPRSMLIRTRSKDIALGSLTGQPRMLQEVQDFIGGLNMPVLAGVPQ